jgi:tellurite resistance protein
MPAPIKRFLNGAAKGVSRSGADAPNKSMSTILAQAASAYSARPAIDDVTMPTGFDPAAVALFESIVEAAFLVANAGGSLDDDERGKFHTLVSDACQNLVHSKQLEALIADLGEMLAEDGVAKRIHMVSRTITRPEHQREVLRVAALLARPSSDAGPAERGVLEQFASAFHLDPDVVDDVLAQAAESRKV